MSDSTQARPRLHAPRRMLFATTAGAGHLGPLAPCAAACRPAGGSALGSAVAKVPDRPGFRPEARRVADEVRGLAPVDDAVEALSALAATAPNGRFA